MPYKDPERKKAHGCAYAKRHKLKLSEYNRIRYAKKREEILAKRQQYYKKNSRKCCEAERQRRLRDPLQYRERQRATYLRRRDKHAETRKRWTEVNAEKMKMWQRQYQIDNRDKLKIYIREYKKKRSASDADFKLRIGLTSRIGAVLRGAKKSQPTMELIGCDLNTLKAHLESQFIESMTWDNYGLRGWHVDHIKPCASFDLTDPEQQRRCFHYTNLQPLWWRENISKSDNLVA